MTDYSPVNPKPSPGTGIDANEGRADYMVRGQGTPSITNLDSTDTTTTSGQLKAAYALGAMGIGSNLGVDAYLAQADLNRDGMPVWEISQIKIDGTTYDVTVAASGANFLIELS